MDDRQRHWKMQWIIEMIENLPAEVAAQFVTLSEETRDERRVAECALSRWQDAAGWTNYVLAEQYPSATEYVDEVLQALRPCGLPYTARTAAVDAIRCSLIEDLQPLPPPGLTQVLCGPVADTLGILGYSSICR